MFLFNLLADATGSGGDTNTNTNTTAQNGCLGMPSWVMYVILGVILVAWIVFSYFTNKKRRAKAEAETAKRNAIKPGFKVTTIGGIVGTVVEVDEENNTFVLQTGNDEHPSLLTFDKLAIYNSVDPDEGKEEPAEGEQVEALSDDEVFPENAGENVETPSEDTPVEEKTEEESTAKNVDGNDAE